MLEDHSRNATVMLPILRDAGGAFTAFGDPGAMHFGESTGRFSGLMPRNKPSVREAAQAKATLMALGMNIVNRGFDPILRVYVECAARLYGDPREADLIKIHLHSRKLTFHYYRDFDKAPLPELLTRIKIDLRRLFVTVIDHTNGREHQLLFFKERFLPKDHPERHKMDRFSAKLRKLGLREETIGYGPSKEKWEAWNQERS